MGLKVERRCSLYPAISSVTRPVVATQCPADLYLQCQCQVFKTASYSSPWVCQARSLRKSSAQHAEAASPDGETCTARLPVGVLGVPAQIRLHDMTNALAPVSVKTLYALSSIDGKLSVSCTAIIGYNHCSLLKKPWLCAMASKILW